MDKKEVKTPPKQVVPPGNNWWYPKPGQTPLGERRDSVGSDDGSQPSSSPGITSPAIGSAFLPSKNMKPVNSDKNMYKEFDNFNF